MESSRLLLCPKYKDKNVYTIGLHYVFYLKIIYMIFFIKLKLNLENNVLTFGQGV